MQRKASQSDIGERELVRFIVDGFSFTPVLVIYNPKSETELHTDASSKGFGAVLLQMEIDGKFHPVSYYSRRTTSAEEIYHNFNLETLVTEA